MSDQAPFISGPDRDPIPPAPWRVFKVPGFMPLFGAQFASSLGDWIGLFAILAIAARVSNSATAVGFVMVARMLPGFLPIQFQNQIGETIDDGWMLCKIRGCIHHTMHSEPGGDTIQITQLLL